VFLPVSEPEGSFPIRDTCLEPDRRSRYVERRGRIGGAATPAVHVSIQPSRAVCVMVQDVGSLLGRAGCRLCRDGGEEADPPCSGVHPDWKMFQTGFSARSSLQDPGPEAKETPRWMGYWNCGQTMIRFPYRYGYRGTGVLLPNVAKPLSELPVS